MEIIRRQFHCRFRFEIDFVANENKRLNSN